MKKMKNIKKIEILINNLLRGNSQERVSWGANYVYIPTNLLVGDTSNLKKIIVLATDVIASTVFGDNNQYEYSSHFYNNFIEVESSHYESTDCWSSPCSEEDCEVVPATDENLVKQVLKHEYLFIRV